MWRAAGLEEPNAKGPDRGSSSAANEEGGEAEQGGFEYDWEARRRARERAFPPAQPRPEAGTAAGSSEDDDE